MSGVILSLTLPTNTPQAIWALLDCFNSLLTGQAQKAAVGQQESSGWDLSVLCPPPPPFNLYGKPTGGIVCGLEVGRHQDAGGTQLQSSLSK